MKIYIDTANNTIVRESSFRAPLENANFKRGDSARVEIIFLAPETVETPDGDRLISFGIKNSGDYDGEFLVFADDFTISGDSYVLNPSFNTEELDAALNHDETEGNDIASVSGMLEISWSDDDGANWLSSNTITANIANDVIKGGEATPVPTQTLLEWLAGVSVITRTAEQGNPNIPSELTITGITDPVVSDPLVLPRVADSGGFPSWALGDIVVNYVSGEWAITKNSGLDYSAAVESAALTPVGLTGWAVYTGAGSPVLTGNTPVPAFVGQKCLVGSSNPVEYTWNGSAWFLSAPNGVIEDNLNPGEYLRIINADFGNLSYEPYLLA